MMGGQFDQVHLEMKLGIDFSDGYYQLRSNCKTMCSLGDYLLIMSVFLLQSSYKSISKEL